MLDILFPETCSSCKDISEQYDRLCSRCSGEIKYIDDWSTCYQCGIPFGFYDDNETEAGGNLCEKCIRATYSFHKARAVAIYDGSIRELIISFKYEGRLNKQNTLIDILISHFPKGLDEFDTIVPVPLHIEKLRQREYNQSVILASGLAKHMGHKCELFGLKRIRDTRPQIELSNENERRKNVRGAFSVVDDSIFKEKSVLLLDDVFTTGSTSDECSKMLLKSGAYKVQVLTLTRAKAM